MTTVHHDEYQALHEEYRRRIDLLICAAAASPLLRAELRARLRAGGWAPRGLPVDQQLLLNEVLDGRGVGRELVDQAGHLNVHVTSNHGALLDHLVNELVWARAALNCHEGTVAWRHEWTRPYPRDPEVDHTVPRVLRRLTRILPRRVA